MTSPAAFSSDWWNARQVETPLFVRTALPSLARDIEELRRHQVKLVIIDTPPALGDPIREVVRQSDLVVIPARPSPHDLRSIGATVELVEQVGRPLVFVINSATRKARITTETVTLLSQHGPLAPAIVHHRVDFASSMIDGRTVLELPQAAAASAEVEKLWSYLKARLGGARHAAEQTRLSVFGGLAQAAGTH